MTTAYEPCENDFQLDDGRWVTIEECNISLSMLGFLCGSRDNPRLVRHVIESLPERIHRQFGLPARCTGGTMDEATRTIWLTSSPDADYFYIKPLPEGEPLPHFVFMVFLISKPISDLRHPTYTDLPYYDGSKLIVCWLSNDITTATLPELIKRETRAIEWNKHAVDFSY
jgi:hypothetical protein